MSPSGSVCEAKLVAAPVMVCEVKVVAWSGEASCANPFLEKLATKAG